MRLLSLFVATLPVVSCMVSTAKSSDTETAADTLSVEVRQNNCADAMRHQALLEAYPDMIREITDGKVILTDGRTVTYDDGRTKNFAEMLDDCDVEDMFARPYRLPDPEPEYLEDVGRGRSEALFKAMYGNSAAAVQRHLVNVDWFGQRVRFNSVNGAADSLRAVARVLARHPELRSWLKSSGTFYWRTVRGSKRQSAHSYGIAFDIDVDRSDYWLWKTGNNNELASVKYANRIPRKIVEIFQHHGFIWGGAWYHFDTMHFEFRPELLRYAKLVASKKSSSDTAQ